MVAANLFVLGMAMVVGFLATGWLTERLSRRGMAPMTIAGWGMAAFIVVQLVLLLPLAGGSVFVWFAGGTGLISYVVVSQSFHGRLTGRAKSTLNLLVFVAAFLAQWGMGVIIHRWEQVPTQHYGIGGYQTAFGLMIALEILALIWYAFCYRRARLVAQREESTCD